MRRQYVRLVFVTLLLVSVPAGARACGTCADTSLVEWSWWTRTIDFLAPALFFEMIVVGPGLRLARVPVQGSAAWLLFGIGGGIGLLALGGGLRSGLAIALGAGLSLRFTRSVRAMRGSHPRIAMARVALVASLVGLGLFLVRPAAQSTDDLIRKISGWDHLRSVPDHLAPTYWAEVELISRSEAPEKLMRRLDHLAPAMSKHSGNRERMLRLLRAHAMADGDAASRYAACQRLGVAPDWHELVGGANAERVCGFSRRDPAASATTGI